MSAFHQGTGESCRTCKKQPTGRIPVVKDCWYDVPYPCLEGFLRILTLMTMLFILCVVIHLTVGQIGTLKPFSSFLERAHLITDASELGILGKPSKEEGLYSPHQDEKEDSEQKGMQALQQHPRNTSKLQDLPMDIYKGTDDENAYFITFREICDEKLGNKLEDTEATPPMKSAYRQEQPKQDIPGLEDFYNQNYQNPHQYLDNTDGVREARIVGTSQIKNDDVLGSLNDAAQKMRIGAYPRPSSNQRIPLETPQETKPRPSLPEQRVRDLTSFESFMRMREGLNKNSPSLRFLSLTNHQNQRSENPSPKPDPRGEDLRGNFENESQQPRQIPNLNILLKDHPKAVLNMKIDLNNLNANAGLKERHPMPNRIDEGVEGDQDGISIEDEEMQAVSADDAKNFLKEKLARQIQSKEDEIMGRMENRPRLKQGTNVMEVEANDLGNLNVSSLGGRKSRAVENIDRSITYTEHERTMKQEVEVTYKRAQDIAKAILKTSEAIANSLDLCRKPISTNFISDEPLTEAEDIIDQIVGQLKESLELTMGCRTCVKPHKDLMLFLRWLIFDDVSVKLCPSKPKAADLRKNYLLFNHDNAFLGRVCGAGEYPRAPLNCSVAGEAKGHGEEDGGTQSKTRSKQVSKNRHRNSNASGNSNNKN